MKNACCIFERFSVKEAHEASWLCLHSLLSCVRLVSNLASAWSLKTPDNKL